jgi:hypothetical protein
VRAVWPFRSLSGARGCARIDSRLDTAKICSDGRADVDHARLRAVLGKWKTFSHSQGHKQRSGKRRTTSGLPQIADPGTADVFIRLCQIREASPPPVLRRRLIQAQNLPPEVEGDIRPLSSIWRVRGGCRRRAAPDRARAPGQCVARSARPRASRRWSSCRISDARCRAAPKGFRPIAKYL